nr:unnamed protein product [Callosobruchus analis]
MGVQAMQPPSTGPPAALPPGSKRKITDLPCPSGPPEAKTARWDTPDDQTVLWDTLEAKNKPWDTLEPKNKSWDKPNSSSVRWEVSSTDRCRKNGTKDSSDAQNKTRDIPKIASKNEEVRLSNTSSLENSCNRLNDCLERLKPSQEKISCNSNALNADSNAWDRLKPPSDGENVAECATNRLNGTAEPLQRRSKNWDSLKLSQDEENVRWERRKPYKSENMDDSCNSSKIPEDSRKILKEPDTSIEFIASTARGTIALSCNLNKEKNAATDNESDKWDNEILSQDAKDVRLQCTSDTTNKKWDTEISTQDSKNIRWSEGERPNEDWDISETKNKQWDSAILTQDGKDVRWNGTDSEESRKNGSWDCSNGKNTRWESAEDCIARLRAVAIPVDNWRSPVSPKGTIVPDDEYEDDEDFEDDLSSDDDKCQTGGNGKSYLELGAAPLTRVQPPNARPRCCDGRSRWCQNPCYRQRRLAVLNMSMCKLARYRQCSDPSLRRSVLICNTLRRLEREMETEPPEPQYHHPPSEPLRLNSSSSSVNQEPQHQMNQAPSMISNNNGCSMHQQHQSLNGPTNGFNTNSGSTFYEQSLREMTSSGRATPFPSGTVPDTDSGLGEDEAMLNKPINWSSVLSLSSQTETDIEVLNNNEFYEDLD